jgi:imidazolonepropionase-like amidohydrolase
MDEPVVLAGGVIFDGTGSPPFRADVVVADGRIAAVGADLGADRTVDVAGRAVLPGFIDCHTHVSDDRVRGLDDSVEMTATYRALLSAGILGTTLDVGITTVRDAAGADAGHRDAIRDGLVRGPRLLVSLMQLSSSAGPNDDHSRSGLRTWVPGGAIPYPVADGPEALRAKVREFVRAGADVIKIFATGHFAMERDGARRSMFTDDELAAIVDEATRQGVRVMAHAHGAAGAAAAARAGVASVDHGIYLDDAAIEAMAENGTFLVPTLLASRGLADEATDDASRERLNRVAAGHREVVAKAHRRGVRIAMGTDCPVTPHGRNLEELGELVACGLTPSEALVSATSAAAQLLGLEDEIGVVAPGMHADLVVIDGDPLDVDGLAARVTAVYRDGRRVGPGAAAPIRVR